MKYSPANLRLAVIASSILVLPFLILELVNRRGYHEGFPVTLFGLLWLLPMAFVLNLMPVIQEVRAENKTVLPRIALLRVAFAILIAWLWISTVLDQIPCFLGVPNCD